MPWNCERVRKSPDDSRISWKVHWWLWTFQPFSVAPRDPKFEHGQIKETFSPRSFGKLPNRFAKALQCDGRLCARNWKNCAQTFRWTWPSSAEPMVCRRRGNPTWSQIEMPSSESALAPGETHSTKSKALPTGRSGKL